TGASVMTQPRAPTFIGIGVPHSGQRSPVRSPFKLYEHLGQMRSSAITTPRTFGSSADAPAGFESDVFRSGPISPRDPRSPRARIYRAEAGEVAAASTAFMNIRKPGVGPFRIPWLSRVQ